MTRARRGLAFLLTMMLAGGMPWPAQAYLKLGTTVSGGRTVQLRWERLPVRYFVTDRGVPGVSAAQFQTTVARAFQTWQDLETSTFSSTFVGFTSANPHDDDGMTVLGYLSRPELERVLGATTFLVNNQTGEILEADIFFNSTFPWSVAPSGEAGRFDLESIALHEIGHLLGLGHSALGETELRAGGGRRVIASEAVMFPIAFSAGSIEERSPRPDDIAGAADIYPASGFRSRTGSIAGRVTKNGRGVFGAHVVAWNPRTGSLIGGFTLNDDGKFVIAGLEPGPHVLRVEPIDDGDVESFLDDASRVDVDFGAAFSSALVVAPRGGTSHEVEIRVNRK